MHGIDNQAKGAGVNGMKILRGCDHKKMEQSLQLFAESRNELMIQNLSGLINRSSLGKLLPCAVRCGSLENSSSMIQPKIETVK